MGFSVAGWSRIQNRRLEPVRDRFGCQVFISLDAFSRVFRWAAENVPDEILVGLDPSGNAVPPATLEAFRSGQQREDLVANFGLILDTPTLINVGSPMSVHHIPEEMLEGRDIGWNSYLHTHPMGPARPSEADKNAAGRTYGAELILGFFFKQTRKGIVLRGADLIAYNKAGYGLAPVILKDDGSPC